MKLFLIAALLALAGCASIKPHVMCALDGKAQVVQTVQGIGVGQELPDANPLCKSLVAPK